MGIVMAKKKHLFECQHCGYQSAKWMGKCVNCGAWESFIEINEKDYQIQKKAQQSTLTKPKPITEIEKESINRIPTGSEELDLVLGGDWLRVRSF